MSIFERSPDRDLLTYDEVAAHLRVCRRTVQRMVKHGLPGTRPKKAFPIVRIGRAVRFRREDVQYVEELLRQAGILPARRGPRPTKAA